MAEYIKKETARAELIFNDELYAADIVKTIPAADVVEVRRGKWEQVDVRDYPSSNLMVASMWCPVCKRYHNEVYHYGNPTEMAHYCGFCGAKMTEV